MRRVILVAACLLILAASGCENFEYPTYLDSQVIKDPDIVGEWVSSFSLEARVLNPNHPEIVDDSFVIEESEDGYLLTYTDPEGVSGTFTLHMAETEDFRFIDISPRETPEVDLQHWSAFEPVEYSMWGNRGHQCYVITEIGDSTIDCRAIAGDLYEELCDITEVVRVPDELELFRIEASELQKILKEHLDKADSWMPFSLVRKDHVDEWIAEYESIF